MKILKLWIVLLLTFVTIITFLSCNSGVSEIGESVLLDNDKVVGNEYDLVFESKTVPSGKVYLKNTVGLLGNIYDKSFGEFKGDFVAQVRTAPGLSFEPTMVEDGIDSTVLRIKFDQFVGSTDHPLKVVVYSLANIPTSSDFSKETLDSYRESGNIIGAKNIIPSRDFYQVSNNLGYRYFDVKIDNNIGNKIYRLSKEHPEYFENQTLFNENVLKGLFVTTSTGRGFIVETLGIELKIYYSVKQTNDSGETEKISLNKSFINTTQTSRINGLSNTQNELLLTEYSDYTFVSSPAGVHTRLVLSKEKLNKLLEGKNRVNLGNNWIITSAINVLHVDVPDNSILNPPKNILIVRTDSVNTFFKNKLSTSGFSAVGMVSTDYNVTSHVYSFSNISGIITNFIKDESEFDNATNSWKVRKDLELDIIPLKVYNVTDSNTGVTYYSLEQYIFPSIVRLSKKNENLHIRIVTSKFN